MLDVKAMGPFVVQKVARLYSQRVTIEDPDGLSGKGMQACLHVVHASHLALFDEPYFGPSRDYLRWISEN